MMIEQMPETPSGQLADMRGVVYDNVKSVPSGFTCDFRQKLFIGLPTLEYLNTFSKLKVLRQFSINADDGSAREIVAP